MLHGGTPLPGTLHASTLDWAGRGDAERWSPEPLSLGRLEATPEDTDQRGHDNDDTDLSEDDEAEGAEDEGMLRHDRSTRRGVFGDAVAVAAGDEAQLDAAWCSGGEGVTSATNADDQVELLYDPQLNCYFDPLSHRYYRLI